jgi:hypothetical protein
MQSPQQMLNAVLFSVPHDILRVTGWTLLAPKHACSPRSPRSMLFEGIVWLWQRGGAGLDPIVRELMMLTALACLGLGLAWAYEADYFAMFFAVAAAFAGVEAVRRSL